MSSLFTKRSECCCSCHNDNGGTMDQFNQNITHCVPCCVDDDLVIKWSRVLDGSPSEISECMLLESEEKVI